MEDNLQEIYYVLINRFRNGDNSAQAHRYLRESYGYDCLSERQCRRWFVKFRSGNFEVKRSPGQGRKMTLNLDDLRETVQLNPRQSTRELSVILNVCQKTICNGLKRIEFVNKRGTWIPHILSEGNKSLRVSIVRGLLERFKVESFLDRVVTCDEKWVLYNNIHLSNQWLPKDQSPDPTPRPGLHPKKVLISVFWDYRGIIHYELLPEGQTINAGVYCAQLDRLAEQISIKRGSLINRKGVIFHQDNARPHTSQTTVQKITHELGWELLPHPPYSPDIAPSDYHLFRSMEHYLRNKNFENRSDLNSGLATFFASKDANFYKRGIFNLVKRWEKVIENDGAYFV